MIECPNCPEVGSHMCADGKFVLARRVMNVTDELWVARCAAIASLFRPRGWFCRDYYNALRVYLPSGANVTFADLQAISEICGGTKAINLVHRAASGTEYTPSGDYCEIVISKDPARPA